jgi:signal transduction histidine kinase
MAVDGEPVRSNADVYRHVESLPAGTPVTYTIEINGKIETRRIETMLFERFDYAFTLGLFVLDGVMGLLAGFLVSLLKPRDAAARGFMLYGFFWGLFPLTGTALYNPDLAWLSRFHWITQAVFPATMIHFGLVFPIQNELVRRRPWLLVVPYAISGILVAWFFHSYFTDHPSWWPPQATFIYSAISMPTFLALAVHAYWQNRNPMVRPRLQMVIPAWAISGAVATYGFVITGFDGNFPINLIAIAPVLFFVSIAYAITAHDAFEINRVLRQTALYFALTVVIAACYAAIVAATSLVVPAGDVVTSIGFQVPVFVLLGFLIQPLRDRLQTLIDATFFRRAVDYRRAVSDVSAALTSVLDLDEIFDRVGGTLTRSFALETFAAIVFRDEAAMVWKHGSPDHLTGARFDVLRSRLEASRSSALTLIDYDTGATTDPALASELDTVAPALIVPLKITGRLLGALVLGRKRSGLPFSRDDLELLDTLAAQSAIAIQNALSYRSLEDLATSLEDRVRERTRELQQSNAELARKHDEIERSREALANAYQELQSAQRQLLQSEKMASLGQLVAGVAHEINNPVSFIVGNLEPLQRRLASLRDAAARHDDDKVIELADRVRSIFETIGRGAERTAGIVQDLRTFSRVGDAERESCDVHESIEVSLRLLKPKWSQRIEIERAYAELPPIHAVPGQINQVFMNIIGNACDAIGDRGTIRISTARDGDDVRISIADDGAGIPNEVLSRIFDPFFTTKRQGQGTGLGLSISHGIVEDHGGRIDVESRVGEGTTFTVRLPIGAASTKRSQTR